MIQKYTETLHKTIKLDNNIYHATYLVECHTDTRWGADADGNRYISRDIIDDVTLVECVDHENEEVTDPETLETLKEMIV